jgi:hypothetical protein
MDAVVEDVKTRELQQADRVRGGEEKEASEGRRRRRRWGSTGLGGNETRPARWIAQQSRPRVSLTGEHAAVG